MGREADERRIRIVVVDDHELMRMGICEQIGRAPDLEVVGEAENGAEALAAVGGFRPDILLLDVGLPDISGVEVARRVRAEYPATRIAVLTPRRRSATSRSWRASGRARTCPRRARPWTC